MNENDVWEFWDSDPCRDHIVGGLRGAYGYNYDGFVATSDPWRHRQEARILDSNTRYMHAPALPVRWLPAKRWLGWHLALGHLDPSPLVPTVSDCSQPAIAHYPLYSDCRWKTQRVDIHNNTLTHTPAVVGCYLGFAGRMAILSNFGTFPDWSPYQGEVIQQAITHDQQIQWRDNSYVGPWTFTLDSVGRSFSIVEWQADPYRQDPGSTFAADESDTAC